MSDPKANDTNLPILVLIRRGRRGRGYLVAPADDPNDVAACADAEELGESIVELLDDPDQARFDPSQIESDSRDADSAADSADDKRETYAAGEELEEYEDDDEEDGDEEPGIFDVDPEEDIATQLLVNIGRATLRKGQELSNSYRKKGTRKNRR